MKRLMAALLATSTLAFAAPALAHPDHPGEGTSAAEAWNNGGDTYAEFNQEYQHIWEGIQHGVSDGSYTQSQAQQYYRAMQDIRTRAEAMERAGRYDPRDTQARLERLHEVMHEAHETGHAVQNSQNSQNGNDWQSDGLSYAEFNQEYRHIFQGIQHGVSDGSYTQRQARSFYRQLQQIRARADAMQRYGRYDPDETQARLERLHDTMHQAHEDGHDAQDRYNYRR